MTSETLRQGDYVHTTNMTRHQLEWTVEQFRKAGALDKDPAWELPLFKGAVTLVWDAIGLYHSNNPHHPERKRDVTGLLQAAYEGEPTPEEEEAWRAKEAFMQERKLTKFEQDHNEAHDLMQKALHNQVKERLGLTEASDGSTASYYELPEGATELQHLISHRNLNAQDGEIFRAIYRKGLCPHSSPLREAKKVLFYAEAEVKRLEALE